ncbi:MAG: hypothetical protein Q4Q14_01215 [Methanobrevibacter sp.]|nr:hypothetical protein [Methanobrevibacter sp.]
MKKITIMLVIAIVAVIGLSAAYAITESNTTNNTTLSVETKSPMTVSEMVSIIPIEPYFKSYNHTTFNWLKEFDSNYVIYTTDEYYLVMNASDAIKINEDVTTGISVTNNITCNVVENRTFGSGLNNILHIENVEVVSSDINPIFFS